MQARRYRGRVTEEEEPEMFGADAIPRLPGAPRKAKVQRSSSSTSATSGSQKEQFTELMQTQINLDREAKKEHMERELAARLAVCEIQKRNEELKILTFDTTGIVLCVGGRGVLGGRLWLVGWGWWQWGWLRGGGGGARALGVVVCVGGGVGCCCWCVRVVRLVGGRARAGGRVVVRCAVVVVWLWGWLVAGGGGGWRGGGCGWGGWRGVCCGVGCFGCGVGDGGGVEVVMWFGGVGVGDGLGWWDGGAVVWGFGVVGDGGLAWAL
ncbi:hypothetical protein Tco_0614698 [Tanacetum coccineum]